MGRVWCELMQKNGHQVHSAFLPSGAITMHSAVPKTASQVRKYHDPSVPALAWTEFLGHQRLCHRKVAVVFLFLKIQLEKTGKYGPQQAFYLISISNSFHYLADLSDFMCTLNKHQYLREQFCLQTRLSEHSPPGTADMTLQISYKMKAFSMLLCHSVTVSCVRILRKSLCKVYQLTAWCPSWMHTNVTKPCNWFLAYLVSLGGNSHSRNQRDNIYYHVPWH